MNKISNWVKYCLEELPCKNGYVLDLACGRGRHSIFLSSLGYNVLSVDIDEHKLNLLPENITRASSIKELAQKCHATITCLPKPEHVLQAVEGKEGILETCSTLLASSRTKSFPSR